MMRTLSACAAVGLLAMLAGCAARPVDLQDPAPVTLKWMRGRVILADATELTVGARGRTWAFTRSTTDAAVAGTVVEVHYAARGDSRVARFVFDAAAAPDDSASAGDSYHAHVASIDEDNIWLRVGPELRRVRPGNRTLLYDAAGRTLAKGRDDIYAALRPGDEVVVYVLRAPATGDPDGPRVLEDHAELIRRLPSNP